ncbi:hypothetical protein C8Q80DRAFT_1135718 [Daedaleopsis nitida]|nr:hypothetical protein C8Q80DRAFT_1135718 [Daedaleopsis nitida]
MLLHVMSIACGGGPVHESAKSESPAVWASLRLYYPSFSPLFYSSTSTSLLLLQLLIESSSAMSIPRRFFMECRNQRCEHGCGQFIPVNDPEFLGGPGIEANPTYNNILCDVCGCRGSQHLFIEPSQPPPSAHTANPPLHTPQFTSSSPFPSFSAPPYRNATESTMFGSRGSPTGAVPPKMGSTGIPTPSAFHSPSAANNSTLHGHGPFREHAARREERKAQGDEGDVSGGAEQPDLPKSTFKPAEKSHTACHQFDKDSSGKKRGKKRHSSPPTSASSNKKSRDNAPPSTNAKRQGKKEPETSFTIVLLPDTGAVHAKTFKKQNINDLALLNRAGLVASDVKIPHSASPTTILNILTMRFSSPMAALLEKHGWGLVEANPSKGQGSTSYLVYTLHGDSSSLTTQRLQQSTATSGVRGSIKAGYPRIVYISLKQGGPEISVPELNKTNRNRKSQCSSSDDDSSRSDIENDDSRQELDSDSPDKMGSDSGDNLPQANGARKNEDVPDVTMSDVNEGTESSKNQHESFTLPKERTRSDSLLHNMSAPEKEAKWWSPHGGRLASFKSFLESQVYVEAMLLRLPGQAGDEETKAALLFDLLEKDVIEPLSFLPELASTTNLTPSNATRGVYMSLVGEHLFGDQFAIGPGGLHAVERTLTLIYGVLAAKEPSPGSRPWDVLVKLRAISTASLALLCHLRAQIPRSHWSPAGSFREFFAQYEHSQAFLPFTLPGDHHMYDLFKLDLTTMDAKTLTVALITAFGHESDHLLMSQYAYLDGLYGLEGFIARVVAPILDEPPFKIDDRYLAVYKVLEACLAALARKIRNFGKSKGKAPSQDKTGATNANKDTGLEQPGGEYTENHEKKPERRQTRSYTKRAEANTNSSHEDASSKTPLFEESEDDSQSTGEKGRANSPISVIDFDSDIDDIPGPEGWEEYWRRSTAEYESLGEARSSERRCGGRGETELG